MENRIKTKQIHKNTRAMWVAHNTQAKMLTSQATRRHTLNNPMRTNRTETEGKKINRNYEVFTHKIFQRRYFICWRNRSTSFDFALLLICEPNVWFGINKNKHFSFSSTFRWIHSALKRRSKCKANETKKKVQIIWICSANGKKRLKSCKQKDKCWMWTFIQL